MTAVSDAPRRISAGEYDRIWAIVTAVDEKGRAMDARWGIGRLPTLVGSELAGRFAVQAHKFGAAVRENDLPEVEKHGAAMERAYAALDAAAVAAGHQPGSPEQWEFQTPDGLVILVRDRNRMNQVETHGRRCQVWSLDEIEEVVRKHPTIVIAKQEFPGAEIVSIRPGRDVKQELDDNLDGLPF